MKGQAKSRIIQDAFNNIDPKREKLINELLDKFENMQLVGQAKKDFEKWLHDLKFRNEIYDNLDANSAISWDEFPPSMQYGVIVDWFDSVGIEIYILENHNISIWYNGEDNVVIKAWNPRYQARQKAIDKAVEIYNKRYESK